MSDVFKISADLAEELARHGLVIVPREPNIVMWNVGINPIYERDVAVKARFKASGLGPEWDTSDGVDGRPVNKGDCAAMVWRAMVAAGEIKP